MVTTAPRALAAACLALALSGCGAVLGSSPRPTPTSLPLPTGTPDIGFAVAVTPASAAVATATARPTATRFVAPHRAYIRLLPASGPPKSMTIRVLGAHLPANAQLQLTLTSAGSRGPVSTSASTDAGGRLQSRFTVPGAAPGRYRIVASLNGVTYAAAAYTVISDASLTVQTSSYGKGARVTVRGQRFLSHLKLLLVAYPMDVRGKPILVGDARTNARGAFRFVTTLRKLPPGQYALRAWSQNALAAQMADTFFQVVI